MAVAERMAVSEDKRDLTETWAVSLLCGVVVVIVVGVYVRVILPTTPAKTIRLFGLKLHGTWPNSIGVAIAVVLFVSVFLLLKLLIYLDSKKRLDPLATSLILTFGEPAVIVSVLIVLVALGAILLFDLFLFLKFLGGLSSLAYLTTATAVFTATILWFLLCLALDIGPVKNVKRAHNRLVILLALLALSIVVLAGLDWTASHLYSGSFAFDHYCSRDSPAFDHYCSGYHSNLTAISQVIKVPGTLSKPTALYFALTTFSTLGLGDISPLNGAGRTVVTVQSALGFLILAVGVGIAVQTIRDSEGRNQT